MSNESDAMIIRALHFLLSRLHGMLAGTVEWDAYTVDTAQMLVEWWEAR